MRDFLRAEWKTLLVAGVGFAVLWAVFFQRETVRSSTVPAEPTVFPGERLGPLELGASPAQVEAVLGAPDEESPADPGPEALGMTRWTYAARGLELTWYAGRLTAIRQNMAGVEPKPQLILPSGDDLGKNLPQARGRLGKTALQQKTEEGLLTRHPGIIVIAADPKAREARAVIVVDDKATPPGP